MRLDDLFSAVRVIAPAFCNYIRLFWEQRTWRKYYDRAKIFPDTPDMYNLTYALPAISSICLNQAVRVASLEPGTDSKNS